MVLLLAILTLVWVSYFVVHIVDLLIKGYSFTIVGNIFPNYLLYSSFPNDWGISYAALISGSLVLVLIAAVFKFINEFRIKHKADVYYLDGEPARYGKIAFNMWNYNTSKPEEAKEASSRVASLFKVLKSEDTTAERVAARTQAEWTRLYIKRTVGITLNFLAILAGWAGIILSKFFLGGGSGTGVLALLLRNLPTVVPTLINGVLPQVIDLAVSIEAWDDPSTALKMRVARLYAAKILNALIQVVAVLIFYRGPIELFGDTRVLTRDCGYVTCEDQIGTTFFTLFITDVIIGTAASVGVAFGQMAVFKGVGMESLAYSEFKPPVQIIKVLYQQIFLWFTLPHFPAVVPIALLLWFIQFRVDVFVLFKFNAKKVTPFDARDSGTYFAMFYAVRTGRSLIPFAFTASSHRCAQHPPRTSNTPEASNLFTTPSQTPGHPLHLRGVDVLHLLCAQV
uniref:TMC domain-containing protein n=2 Tax=Hemiselmis andersenii TaxID=464988 RepID=A0A6U4VEP4_HEMAN|mmetsp:Transcript_27668/g.67450  ORF Transcript_27668/g.67450 Transcript_27668/m.67450 type:complete len:453 (+) Transcript_27668:723-2081(+)